MSLSHLVTATLSVGQMPVMWGDDPTNALREAKSKRTSTPPKLWPKADIMGHFEETPKRLSNKPLRRSRTLMSALPPKADIDF